MLRPSQTKYKKVKVDSFFEKKMKKIKFFIVKKRMPLIILSRPFITLSKASENDPVGHKIFSVKRKYDMSDILYGVMLVMILLNVISLLVLHHTVQNYEDILGQLIETHKVNYQLKQELLRLEYQEKWHKANLNVPVDPNQSQTYWARVFGISGLIFLFALGAYVIFQNAPPPPIDPDMAKAALTELSDTGKIFTDVRLETELRGEWITEFYQSYHEPISERNSTLLFESVKIMNDCQKQQEYIQGTIATLYEWLKTKK